MVWIKKHKLLLLLLTFVYSSYFFNQYKHQYSREEVLGASENVLLFQEPLDGREPILEAIDDAGREIHVAMYLLSDRQIIDELIEEKEEGTDVRVMLEERPYGGGTINQRAKKILEDADIAVQWTNPKYALTHQKAFIIDDSKALILNQNMTTSSFGNNREFNIIDEDLGRVAEIEKMFISDWNRKSFSPSESDLVISPYNARGKLTALIKYAASSIDIEMEILQDSEIVNLLSEKAKTISVRVIVPEIDKITSNSEFASRLKKAGVMVREISSPHIHAKLLLVDNLRAYVGSVNFSTQSMDQNRELGIIVSEEDVIETLTETFGNDWELAQEIN